MNYSSPRTLLIAASCLALLRSPGSGQSDSHAAVVATSDVRLELRLGPDRPQLLSLAAPNLPQWRNEHSEALPLSVEINGKATPVAWRFDRKLSHADTRSALAVYECENPHLRLRWEWTARAGFGPVEHRTVVENLTGQEVWLPMIDSLHADWTVPSGTALNNFYVEKGADTPSPQGTHFEPIGDGYAWTGKSSTYAFPVPGEAREIIPAAMVYTGDALAQGWYAGIEFSGRTRISLARRSSSLQADLGLNPDPGPFRTRVEAGGAFETPTAFIGAFSGGPDEAANQLRRWVREVLGDPITWKDEQYPLLVNNSWGSGTQVDESLALRMIDESKELGLEMFHLDAGWFRGVGDWYPDPRKFPHGLAYVADAAHARGLRFGIWVDWTQAGLDTAPGALNVHDPKVRDWMVTDLPPDWKPEEFKGQTVDVGVPAAHAYLRGEVKRIVDDYHLDMLEHDGYLVAQGCIRTDHPHAPPNQSTLHIQHDWASDFVVADNSTDVSYHAVRAYYDIHDHTRREHPGLLFEICNDGGRMVDFGSAAHGDYFSITDTYDPLSNRRAFYDTSYMLPPAMLESYVEKWPAPSLGNFLYMMRSGMMGWLSIMLDTTAWSSEQHDAAKHEIELYKQQLRPLIRDAHLYHVSARPDGIHWDGMEYWDPARARGVVFAFRGTTADEDEHHFRLKGLEAARRYHLHFEDGSAPDRDGTGAELMSDGFAVHLKAPLSSELIFLSSAGQPR